MLSPSNFISHVPRVSRFRLQNTGHYEQKEIAISLYILVGMISNY